jgi:hypothetical protein
VLRKNASAEPTLQLLNCEKPPDTLSAGGKNITRNRSMRRRREKRVFLKYDFDNDQALRDFIVG